MNPRIALLWILLACLPSSVLGQSCGPARVGDRARVTVTAVIPADPSRLTPGPLVVPDVEILEGVIQEITPDRLSLVVATRERWIDRSRIVAIEVLCVTRGFAVGSGLLVGAAGGALIGGAVGCVTGERDPQDGTSCDFNRNEERVLTWALVGAAVGAVVGAVVALGTQGRDWAPAELPFRVAPTVEGGWVVGISIPVGPG